MARIKDSKMIGIMHPICCGLDVHKESISACVIFSGKDGVDQHDIKVFGTFTIVAIAHRMLLEIYHVIKDGVGFRDLGEDCLTQRNKSLKLFQLQKQAQSLGFSLVPQAT